MSTPTPLTTAQLTTLCEKIGLLPTNEYHDLEHKPGLYLISGNGGVLVRGCPCWREFKPQSNWEDAGRILETLLKEVAVTICENSYLACVYQRDNSQIISEGKTPKEAMVAFALKYWRIE